MKLKVRASVGREKAKKPRATKKQKAKDKQKDSRADQRGELWLLLTISQAVQSLAKEVELIGQILMQAVASESPPAVGQDGVEGPNGPTMKPCPNPTCRDGIETIAYGGLTLCPVCHGQGRIGHDLSDQHDPQCLYCAIGWTRFRTKACGDFWGNS